MKRRFDWRSRLHAELKIWATQSFRWGDRDCVWFADGCVRAMTGESALSHLEDYADADGARKALAALGYASLSGAVAARFDPVEPILAREGDLAVIAGEELGEGLGIVLGERVAVMAPSGGYGTVPRRRIVKAFIVP